MFQNKVSGGLAQLPNKTKETSKLQKKNERRSKSVIKTNRDKEMFRAILQIGFFDGNKDTGHANDKSKKNRRN